MIFEAKPYYPLQVTTLLLETAHGLSLSLSGDGTLDVDLRVTMHLKGSS